MANLVICSQCGSEMPTRETVNGKEVDWLNETPVCAVCRGEPGAQPAKPKKDVLSGFAWKRDPETKRKVPK